VFGLQTVGPIAAGAFSMVVRATDVETGCTVAVKTFNKARCSRDPRLASASAAELRVLRLLAPDAHHHLANLVRVHENVQSVHLVLEYCAGGSLQRRLQGLQRKGVPEAEAAMMSRQLCSAIAHLHARGVAHRDVKPANVLYVDGASGGEGSTGIHIHSGRGSSRLKLCDFGFATFVPAPGRCHTRCGTPIYMAPELHKDGKEGYLPAPIDCWALGALVFELLHAKQAFSAETIERLVSRIRNASHASFTPTISTQAKDFIQALLTIKAAARCTAKQALAHAWLATTPPGAT
jgi:serine/threonine protein kinase